jgi:pantoate--beta-alanine ligase
MSQQSAQKSARYTSGEVTVHTDPAELGRVSRALRGVGRKISLVPTMGALHAGHLEIIKQAKRVPGTAVVVSIFVNPLQFGPDEDFDRYPRAFESDVAACREAGVELVFAPGLEQMYPDGPNRVTVHPGPLGEQLEGASRPGHFAGVLTVVNKLLNIVAPDYALFGEKDYQQLVLIRRMARDLNMPGKIVGVPTVREADGLALSSRNAFLDPGQRETAVGLSAALAAGRAAGALGASDVLAAAQQVLDAAGLVPDYLELRDRELGDPPEHGRARLLVAAKVGSTRLIDNAEVTLGLGEEEG